MGANKDSCSGDRELIPNFRRISGVDRIYRSSAPEDHCFVTRPSLPQLVAEPCVSNSENVVLRDATLIIDLRSRSEINEDAQRQLIQQAKLELVDGLQALSESKARKQLLSLTDIALKSSDVTSYIQKNWLKPEDLDRLAPGECPATLVYEALNKNGLAGLYQILLEKRTFFCSVLKAVTIHLERNPNGIVVFHCSVGKDRTGLLSMLSQSMLGVPDDVIIQEYSQSSCIHKLARKKFSESFGDKLDCESFACADPQVMKDTIKYIRDNYESVPSYLDAIGFTNDWRARFTKVIVA